MSIKFRLLNDQLLEDTGIRIENWDPQKSPAMNDFVDKDTEKTRIRTRKACEKFGVKWNSQRAWAVGAVSGMSFEIEGCGNTLLDPGYTKQMRTSLRRSLGLLNQEYAGFLYYSIVVTAGANVPFYKVKKVFDKIMKKAGRLRNLIEISIPGAEPLLRTTEIAFQKISNETTGHVHLHALIRVKQPLSSFQVKLLEARISKRFGGVVKACLINGDINAIVRYMLKEIPSSILTDNEFDDVFEMLQKRRLVEAMGPFKAFKKELKESGLTVYERHDGKFLSVKKAEREKKDKPDSDKEPRTFNIVLKFLAARGYFTGYTEPILLVKNYTGDFNTLLEENPFIQEFVREARREYERKRRKVA